MKTLSKALLVTASLLVAGTALAHDREHDRAGHRGSPGMALPVVEHLSRAMRQLELSDEQKDAIHADFKGMKEQIKPLMKAMHESRRQLHEVITAEVYDQDSVARLAGQQGELTAEITHITSAAVAGIFARLSNEQRAELEAMGERHKARRDERRERFEARKERHSGEQ